jgi:hypothetical protein
MKLQNKFISRRFSMTARGGFVLAEMGHVVNILPPVDMTGGKKTQAFSMANWEHASILLQVGISAAAWTSIILQAGTATAAIGADVANAAAIPFNIYKQETTGADKDVAGARTNKPATGEVAPSANDNIFYVIEVDAAELPAGKPYLQVVLANGANSVIASAAAILSGGRFAGVSSPTVTV